MADWIDINVRLEEEKDYRRVEEITRVAFSYPDRIKRKGLIMAQFYFLVDQSTIRSLVLKKR